MNFCICKKKKAYIELFHFCNPLKAIKKGIRTCSCNSDGNVGNLHLKLLGFLCFQLQVPNLNYIKLHNMLMFYHVKWLQFFSDDSASIIKLNIQKFSIAWNSITSLELVCMAFKKKFSKVIIKNKRARRGCNTYFYQVLSKCVQDLSNFSYYYCFITTNILVFLSYKTVYSISNYKFR